MTEFGFIEQIRTRFASLPDNGFEGIGDDCAVLPLGGGESLVFTADLLTEGVHFLRAATTPRELGGKSLAVNLSDVAAMGARPVATLLSIALPADAAGAWAAEFMEGYRELSETFGTALIGGDTTRSESGITINVTAIGRAPSANLKRRSDARPGDVIFAAAASWAPREPGSGHPRRTLRHSAGRRAPQPAAAGRRGPLVRDPAGGARHDGLSDGLASDLRHILDRSGVGAEVEIERIPRRLGADVRTAACAGEDYKLLLTAAPGGRRTPRRGIAARFEAPSTPSAASPPHRVSCGSATENPSRWSGTGSNIIDGKSPRGCLLYPS